METEYKIGDIWESKFGVWDDKDVDWNSGPRETFKIIDIEGEYALCERLSVCDLSPDRKDELFYQIGYLSYLRIPFEKYNNRRLISRL